MKIKQLISIIIPVVLGLALGIGGTIGVQKFLLPKSAATTQAVTVQDGPVVEIGEFTVNLQGGGFPKNVDCC